MNLFENTPIRSCNDISSGKHWFSAIDICAALRSCDYQTARNYWKWLKAKLFTSQPVSVTNQLKMQAQDGKLRHTDVVDAEGVLQMIQLCPSPSANAFRIWIAELVNDSKYSDSETGSKTDDYSVIKCMEDAVVAAKDKVRTAVGTLLKTIRMTDFCLFDEVLPLHLNTGKICCNT